MERRWAHECLVERQIVIVVFWRGRAHDGRCDRQASLCCFNRQLRAAPGTGSEIVAKIPGGSLVDASACDGGWCEIAWQDKKGFAIQSALDMSGRVPQQRAAAVAPRPAYRQGPDVVEGPEVVEGPVYYDPPAVVYYGGPYYRPYYRPYWGWRRHGW